jgi:hypothetical protein
MKHAGASIHPQRVASQSGSFSARMTPPTAIHGGRAPIRREPASSPEYRR